MRRRNQSIQRQVAIALLVLVGIIGLQCVKVVLSKA